MCSPTFSISHSPWWRNQMETFSALLAPCAGKSPVTGEFPSQRPVTWSFDVFFDQRLNKQLSKQSGGWWFETPSCPIWHHYNENMANSWLSPIHQLLKKNVLIKNNSLYPYVNELRTSLIAIWHTDTSISLNSTVATLLLDAKWCSTLSSFSQPQCPTNTAVTVCVNPEAWAGK